MSAWRETEDAPRDGTRILGWFRDRSIVVFWRSGPGYKTERGQTVWYWSDGYSRYPEPDFWQPEPEPPAGARRAPPFEAKLPGPKVVQQRPQRTLAERRATVRHEVAARTWCAQCERRVSPREAGACSSTHCKAKLGHALSPVARELAR